MFDHTVAQEGEFDYAESVINESYVSLLEKIRSTKNSGNEWHDFGDFFKDTEEYAELSKKLRTSNCLEIGSGPYGYLAFCDWMERRTVIDPLLNKYVDCQKRVGGFSIFDGVTRISQPAELFVEDLENSVDFLVCRNCIDHSEDPLHILYNISRYLKVGGYLLFWVEIWHGIQEDHMHRNITKSKAAFLKIVEGMGFSIDSKSIFSYTDHDVGFVARKL